MELIQGSNVTKLINNGLRTVEFKKTIIDCEIISEDEKLKKIDLQGLKQIGLSNNKISKMLGVSIKKVDEYIKCQNKIREFSGVF